MKLRLDMKCDPLLGTGKPAGPSLYHLLEVLGKGKVMARIERALASF